MRSQGHEQGLGASRFKTWLPGAALLGVLLPLLFLERLQSYSYYMSGLDLLGAYATTVLLALPFAGALTLLSIALSAVARLLPASRRGLAALVGPALFALALSYGLLLATQVWLTQWNPSWAQHLPRLRWVLPGALLCFASFPTLRKWIAAWHGPALLLAALGSLSLLALPLLGWESLPHSPRAQTSRGAKPDILFITFDALTASHMSLYGYTRPTTPLLEQWARDGIVMERFYAAGNYTTTTVNSIMTGAYGSEHGALQLMSWPKPEYRAQSLPAALQQAGYRTLAVSTNPLAGPYKNGYGAYFDAVLSDQIFTYFSGRDGPSRWLKYLGPVLENPLINALWQPMRLTQWFFAEQRAGNRHYDPQHVFQAAKHLLQTQPQDRPIFMWIHLLPPHSPYAAPSPFLGRFEAGEQLRSLDDSTPPFMFEYGKVDADTRRIFESRYDEAVLYLDNALAQFLAWSDHALGAQAITLISADHGESFSHDYGGHAGPLLTEPLVHIPMIVKGAGLAKGVRLQAVTGQIDIAPTLAELAGAAQQPLWRGHSFASLLRSGRDDLERSVLTLNLEQSPRWQPLAQGNLALITQRWKYLHVLGRPNYPLAPAFADHLYDLQADPGESQDLSAVADGRAHAMRRQLQEWMQGQ